jgi:SNF2 family DNA or RNA helicase
MINSNIKESNCSFDWRVVMHTEKSSATFDKFTFTSNKKDIESEQPPNFRKYSLRKEQSRSLTWMLNQERSNVPFLEEEVCENVLPSLDWRAEGRTRRPVLVRGGIIADEVGYGKTCITLACIDSNSGSDVPKEAADTIGFFATKATLVVVPGHLMGQWPNEVRTYVPNVYCCFSYCRLTILDSFHTSLSFLHYIYLLLPLFLLTHQQLAQRNVIMTTG